MKIKELKKLVANLHEKIEYVIHIRNLKQALNQILELKKVHRTIRFNKKAWLKSYIDMNTYLMKKAKNDFEKELFQLMNNAVYERCEKKWRYQTCHNREKKKKLLGFRTKLSQ